MVRESCECVVATYLTPTQFGALERFARGNALPISTAVKLILANSVPGFGGLQPNVQHREAAE